MLCSRASVIAQEVAPMLKYIKKNLKTFIKTDKLTFVMIQLCVFLSAVMLCFSYGIYRNYEAERLAWEGQTTLRIAFPEKKDGTHVTKGELNQCLKNMPERLLKEIEAFYVSVQLEEGLAIECTFSIWDGKFTGHKSLGENMIRNGFADLYFTEEQEENGEAAALLTDGQNMENRTPAKERLLQEAESGYIELQGKSYRVIGRLKGWDDLMVPWMSLDDTSVLGENGVTLGFYTAFTAREYQEISDFFQGELGSGIKTEPMEGGDRAPKRIIWTMIMTAGLIAAVTAVDFSLLYLYLLEKRKSLMGIFLICGMNRGQVTGMYFLECLLCILPGFLLGMGCWHFALLPLVGGIYRYMERIYTVSVYAGLVLLFLAISAAVMGAAVVRKLMSIPVREYLL